MARTLKVRSDFHYGNINGHILGKVMKELVRRAILNAQAGLTSFEVTEKPGYDGVSADVFTDLDVRIQTIYVKGLRECFPEFGIIGEEGGLCVPFTGSGRALNFTADPIDGTKALTRRQSHGIGTMIALILGRGKNARVIGAYVGDVMTGEIFGFRPGSTKVHRISKFEMAEVLSVKPGVPLGLKRVLLFDDPSLFGPHMRRVLPHRRREELFKDFGMGDGSVGLLFARLWKGEVGAIALLPNHQTPWDTAPVLGISKVLGFKFMAFDRAGKLEEAEEFQAPPLLVERTKRDVLVVHESNLAELCGFVMGLRKFRK